MPGPNPFVCDLTTAQSTQVARLGYHSRMTDINVDDAGEQDFLFVEFDDAVIVNSGSPVGEEQAQNGHVLTSDQSLAGAGGWVGWGGGISMIAVAAAGGNLYGYAQILGLNRLAISSGGTVTAGTMCVWDGDDTVNDMAAGEEHLVGGRALVAAAAVDIGIRSLRLM